MRKPLVAIRTDLGPHIGFGHLRRCLTLAMALQNQGAGIGLFLNRDQGSPQSLERMRGVNVIEVDQNDSDDLRQTMEGLSQIGARVLVVDSYQVSADALDRIRVPLAVIVDQMPAAPLPVDILVNGGATACGEQCLALPRTKALLGPSYVLLRQEFGHEPNRVIRERVERVLVTTGGSDPLNLSPAFVELVREVLGEVSIEVIVGPYFSAETTSELERLAAANHRIELPRNPADIRNIMLKSDLALTGGGQTTYEIAATGTPAVAVQLAKNQIGNLQGLSEKGVLVWAGDAGGPDLQDRIRQSLGVLAQDRDARERMSRAGRALVDGRGANRVAEEILQLC